MDQFATSSHHDIDYEEALESLADESRDTMASVVDGSLQLRDVHPSFLLNEVWMNDLFQALCQKKYGRSLTMNQFYRIRAVSYLERIDTKQEIV